MASLKKLLIQITGESHQSVINLHQIIQVYILSEYHLKLE